MLCSRPSLLCFRNRSMNRFLPRERGATAVEYALMCALVAVVVAVAVGSFGTAVSALFVIPAGALP